MSIRAKCVLSPRYNTMSHQIRNQSLSLVVPPAHQQDGLPAFLSPKTVRCGTGWRLMSESYFQATRMGNGSRAASYTPGEKEKTLSINPLSWWVTREPQGAKSSSPRGWCLFQKVTCPPLPRKLKQAVAISNLCTTMPQCSLQFSGSRKLHYSYQKVKVKVRFTD